MSGRDVRQILEQHGFRLVRQKGSHMIMQVALGSSTITIPVPDHNELRLGTLSSIIRQSRLPSVVRGGVMGRAEKELADEIRSPFEGVSREGGVS